MSPFWIGVSVFALCIGLSLVAVMWKWVSRLIPATTPTITGRTLAYLGIVVSVACVLLLGWLFRTEIVTLWQGTASSLAAVLQGTPLWLAAVTIALFVTAFVVGPRLKLATFVAATLLLIYVTYAYRNDILEIGYTRLLLYIVAISTAVLLGKALKGGTRLETWSALLTVAAVFILLGLSHPESKYVTDKFVEWWNTPSAPVQTTRVPEPERRVARTPTEPCDNKYKPYIVYPTPSVITYETGCFVGVNVVSTAPVILIGDNGEESEPIYTDSPDKAISFRIVRWKTLPGQVAHVQARLYRN